MAILTEADYDRLFRDHPPTKPHALGGDALERLAIELGRSTGAVSAQWNDARSAVLRSQTAASKSLVAFLVQWRWLTDASYLVSAPCRDGADERLAVLASSLPSFEEPGFEVRSWTPPSRGADGAMIVDHHAFSPAGQAFVQAIDE